MDTVKMEDLESYVSTPVEVCIYGRENEDMAPWVKRKISNLQLCPDKTHLRIYFDKHFFFAVPLSSQVTQSENQWVAFDQNANLHYAIKNGA